MGALDRFNTGVELESINPRSNPAFSPNLFKWVRSRRPRNCPDTMVRERVYSVLPDTLLAKVYGEGALFIGHPFSSYSGDSDFSGAPLMHVLCNGPQSGGWCVAGGVPQLVEVEDFWPRYLQVGRCAIDPKHGRHFFAADRYREHDGVTTCLWCAAVVSNDYQERKPHD